MYKRQGNLTDLVVELRETLSVSGRVETQGGGGAASIGRPTIFAEPADGNPAFGNPSTRVSADGSFVLSGLIGGRYLLRTIAGPLVASVEWQGRVVTDSGLDTASGSDLDRVVVKMSDEGGILSGSVDGTGAAEQAAVLVFPADSALWRDFGWNPTRIRVVQTDQNGAYNVTRLPAGDYLVIATDVGAATSFVDPNFLAAAAKQAVRQMIGWGEKASRDLAISVVVKK